MAKTAGVDAAALAGKRPHKLKYAKWGLIFILPFFITYAVFQLYPLVSTFYKSFFMEYKDGLDWIGPEFIGFDNYIELFTKSNFLQYFGNTMVLWLLGFIPQLIFSLLFASWFTDLRLKLKGTGFVKVVLYLPNILMASSIAVLFFKLFGDRGPVNDVLAYITGNAAYWENKGTTVFSFINSEWGTRGIVAFINYLMWTGNTTILLMAGIMGIDPALYEASSIDGANAGQQFRKITMPMLKPIMLYVMVTSLIGGLQMFDIPRLFTDTKGGPGSAAMTAVMLLNNNLGLTKNYGMAGAMSVVLFIVAGVLSVIIFGMLQDNDEKDAKKARKKAAKAAKKAGRSVR